MLKRQEGGMRMREGGADTTVTPDQRKVRRAHPGPAPALLPANSKGPTGAQGALCPRLLCAARKGRRRPVQEGFQKMPRRSSIFQSP